MAKARSGERRQAILATLARMLQEQHGERITTARLAHEVGVSEAALYRHFPSKAKMFEGLLEFIEESLFTRINRILAEEPAIEARLRQILFLVLAFVDKNPGMARILYGDILTGETERLRHRVAQIFNRIETQFRQILREGGPGQPLQLPPGETADLLLTIIEGRIARIVRSCFRVSPIADWEQKWSTLAGALVTHPH